MDRVDTAERLASQKHACDPSHKTFNPSIGDTHSSPISPISLRERSLAIKDVRRVDTGIYAGKIGNK